MVTIEMIKQAQSKVKSGADFPAFAKELHTMGIKKYDTSVKESLTVYEMTNGDKLKTPSPLPGLEIGNTADKNEFVKQLKIHQQGGTDFPTFRKSCAELGVEKWIVDLDKFTCTYYSSNGQEVLKEEIPR